MNELIEKINITFKDILTSNVYENNLSDDMLRRRVENKYELKKALKHSVYGEQNSKIYVKEYIKHILLKKFQINQENIEQFLLSPKSELSIEIKFQVILHLYKKKYGFTALGQLIQEHNLDILRMNKVGEMTYEITEDDIDTIYSVKRIRLEFDDKLEILSQMIFQYYKGFGAVDELLSMQIDGISGGVSGEENDFNSIWIMYKGKTIYLPFLQFSNQCEIERVCRNIYRYNAVGQLSESNGYIVSEMIDKSRAVVARPPFCESWVFFIRKFSSVKNYELEELFQDKGSDFLTQILMWIVKGNQVSGITGSQGSGKTTLLMGLIKYINPTYTLRVQEMNFELHLRSKYPCRNIVTFRETSHISGQEGLNIQKKTDGVVSILGEVANAEVAFLMIQLAKVASLFTLFTHHANTTNDLIISLRNALLQGGVFSNENVALDQVVQVMDFDIHMNKTSDGHRYVERIVEIIDSNMAGEYSTNIILEWEHGEYKYINSISQSRLDEMNKFLTEEEQNLFKEQALNWKDYK